MQFLENLQKIIPDFLLQFITLMVGGVVFLNIGAHMTGLISEHMMTNTTIFWLSFYTISFFFLSYLKQNEIR